MDLIKIKNLVKQMVNENFQTKSDLHMLMQFFGFVWEQYQQTLRIPEFLVNSNQSDTSLNEKPGSNDSTATQASSNLFEEEYLTPRNSPSSSQKRTLNHGESESSRSKMTRSRTLTIEDSTNLEEQNLALNSESITPQQSEKLQQTSSSSKSSQQTESSISNHPSKSNFSSNATIATSIKEEPREFNQSTATAKNTNTNNTDTNTNMNAANTNNNANNSNSDDELSDNQKQNYELIINQIEMIRNEIKGNFKEAKSYVNIKESWSLLCDFTLCYENSKIFVDLYGINLILHQAKFLNRRLYTEVYINMIGLLGNISEFRKIRAALFRCDLIKLLRELLSDNDDTIAYLASRVLINLIESGDWLNYDIHKEHDYSSLIASLSTVIKRLDVKKKLNLNNLSLKAILILLESDHEICVKWACWTLVNFTMHNPNKYVPIINDTTSINVLNKILNSKRGIYENETKELSKKMLMIIGSYRSNQKN